MSSSTRANATRPNNARKRVPKACVRCRDQKIRCSGSQPCQQCDKRGSVCQFDDESRKVVVSRGYINRLQERLAALESKSEEHSLLEATTGRSRSTDLSGRIPLSTENNEIPEQAIKTSASISPYGTAEAQDQPQLNGEGKAPLTNPLAFHTYDFVPSVTGHILFMGTSSNWSFNKRVLTMTHERVKGRPLSMHNLHFAGTEGKVFDLKWDGARKFTSQDVPDTSALPTKDFALYLINSVKFHCGWLYSLFDEDIFMERFRLFHENPSEYAHAEPLWFVHYLLVLAFGKAFVVQSTKSRRPPGGDFFIQAMKLMPDFNFFDCDIIEEMQVLCCAALYLQSVDHIQQAYRLVCSALRHGLEHGIHTEMQSDSLDAAYVQRSRHMFWTLYILERQLISLLGLPLSIADETISARFPDFPGQPQKLEALNIHVDFCRVLAKINQTVYGLEGKLDSRYLGATQSVLKSIATVTERLNKSFEIQASEGMAGISRISAHLHLMQHQCIILTTRPLLYTFLLSRLGHLEVALMHWLQSESVKGLVQMCTESAQQILRILSSLSEQGLLEIFLKFDQDAAFTATIALLMAAAIDSSLLPDHTPWTQRAYGLFDEMNSRGNLVANMVAAELKQLEDLLKGFLASNDSRPVVATQGPNTPRQGFMNDIDSGTGSVTDYAEPFSIEPDDDFGLGLNYELSAEQLLNIANSLDIDSLTWPWPEDPMAEDVDDV
ncbi:related to positive activator of transcription [Fusarium fujikuroi IMI 58289]|uniref:Related to positive activator of transcription n=1 Tax=Gibberella fujikuroi (strain CBS 195.34 / IMI 58289 / NRRL A-6831) TaxID=1279085 RepID=S0EGU9_GIBF5|nr:related to positive activator of transcription [Fusarium fujikuroi IMI 58289]KLO96917.1 positive activator of transcription [Fusarium fujikuroi]CCT71603.1 related to positive activator of transcription [Fusarium fujikuroi IMI 58289]SCO20212.1 related to positive activator of transcription [Fusarium fujikuroi]SCO51537.1 related to positive activator of transcription [Fusarium fujikuroi]